MELPLDVEALRAVLRAHRVAFALVFEEGPRASIRWQADTRKRHLDEAFRRERFRRDFARAHG